MNFYDMLMGHLVGDYLFQNNAMALNKGKNTPLGWFACFGHCFAYTCCMAAFTNYDWKWLSFVFVTHFIVDKFSLAEHWLRHYKSRSVVEFLEDKNDTLMVASTNKGDVRFPLNINATILQGGFTSFVYVVTDNTIHLLLQWYVWRWISA